MPNLAARQKDHLDGIHGEIVRFDDQRLIEHAARQNLDARHLGRNDFLFAQGFQVDDVVRGERARE